MLKIENQYGTIEFSNDVLANIVGNAAASCYGVADMAKKSAGEGLVSLIKKNNLDKGVKVTSEEDGALTIDLHIVVTYGVNIKAISESIINKVKYSIEEITGLEVRKINVYVDTMKVV
jgi:uncharacterized alkaline shock family protein YloU